jgi:predicted ATPase
MRRTSASGLAKKARSRSGFGISRLVGETDRFYYLDYLGEYEMPIDKLVVSNFKGIAEEAEFDLKPVTFFIGPNSSGKSSCIHALAALSQTIKLSGSKLPIVLDDQYALVHLGRFIEVIHSKSYSDQIGVGFSFVADKSMSRVMRRRRSLSKEAISKDNPLIDARYSFKSTRRTQDIFIEKTDLAIGDISLSYRRKPKASTYSIRLNGKPISGSALNTLGMKFTLIPPQKPVDEFFDTFVFNEQVSELISAELRRTLYLGPFRQSPQRRYATRGSAPVEVGAEGEAAATLLANEYVRSKSRPHIKEISRWMNVLGLAKSVEVSRVGKSDLFDVKVTLPDDVSLPIADLGYGISQVLPVLAQLSFAPKGATLLFEQPELHLHPAAAGKLALVFAEVAKQKNLHIVAETHSRELFFETLRAMNRGVIALEDIAAYEVAREDGRSVFKRIAVEEDNGRFEVYSPWDKGICTF